MKRADVQIAGGMYDTEIQCSKCEEAFFTQVWAYDEIGAEDGTISEAREEGWTSDSHGPLCPKCVNKKEKAQKEPKKKK